MCNALGSFTHAGSRECVMLTLSLSALPGTVLDKDGQGTGFTYVQPNTTGNQYDATRINLEPTAGTLVLTGTLGPIRPLIHLRTRYNFRLMPLSPLRAVPGSKVRLPISLLPISRGGTLGSSQDNYVKLVIVKSGSGLGLQFYQEQNGVRSSCEAVYPKSQVYLGRALNLDLYLTGDPKTETIAAPH